MPPAKTVKPCTAIAFGTHECTYAIYLPWKVNGEWKCVNIDKCLVHEVIDLWEQGIRTIGSCCGHGKPHMQPPYIQVAPEFSEQMRELGYKERPRYENGAGPWCFVPKTDTSGVRVSKATEEWELPKE